MIWTDESIAVSISTFIDKTVEVYNTQLLLKQQAAKVDRSLWELLKTNATPSLLNEGSQISECSENLQNELEIVNNSPDSSQISLINDEQSDLPSSSCLEELQSQSVVVDDNTDITTAYTTADPNFLQITTAERGGSCLLENNFVYTKHRKINNKIHWQCIQRTVCNARIHTLDDTVVARINVHNYEPNSPIFYCAKLKAGIKRNATQSKTGTHSILNNSISELPEGSAVKLPRINILKQTIRRARKRTNNASPEPNSLNYLEIPHAFTKTDKGDRFLLYDSGVTSGNQRILIFGTESNIDVFLYL